MTFIRTSVRIDDAAREEARALGVADPAAQRQEAVQQLRRIAFDLHQGSADPQVRDRAADLLDRMGEDDRPELDPRRPEFWSAPIAPGPFRMGRDDGAPDERPAFEHTIARPYALSRFPITNWLYHNFLQAVAWMDDPQVQVSPPKSWGGPRYRPGTGSHPVSEVSWVDACTFAAWLFATLWRLGVVAKNEVIRLPTEPEWERAAAYPAQGGAPRPYPWGGWQHDRANLAEAGFGRTTPVGIFPAGTADCGAQEMAGNVWEWCSTPHQPYPLPAGIKVESVYITWDHLSKSYALRGGSWQEDERTARCTTRARFFSYLQIDSMGFRVARELGG